MKYQWYRMGWKILDFLIPPRCGGCGTWGVRWCDTCQSRVRLITGKVCSICGEPLLEENRTRCERCRTIRKVVVRIRSWATFSGPIQNAIHRIKYHRDFGLAERMARSLIAMFQDLPWEVDFVIPVPLDEQRMQERGYNQAALLAKPFAWALELPYNRQALGRVRITQSQVGLSRSERKKNVRGAFEADPNHVVGRRVLIIDDVITTGATLIEAARALRRAGAETVFGLTLARSVLQ